MSNKNMKRAILIVGSLLLIFSFIFRFVSIPFTFSEGPLTGFFYWSELLFVVYSAYYLHLPGNFVSFLALSLFVLGGLLNVFGLTVFGEEILRFGFVIWLVGMGRLFVER